jgi:hypothetical protein
VSRSAAETARADDWASGTATYAPIGHLEAREQLRQLELRMQQVEQRIVQLQRGASVEARVRTAADVAEREARAAADAALDRKLADLAVGGLTVEWWGVVAFLLGTIFGAISDELAGWLT